MRCWGVIAWAVAVLWVAPTWAQDVRGVPRVIDGDTLAIDTVRVRLFGIDAPERGQPCRDGGDCGAQATAFLTDLIGDRPVRCIREDVDQYGRVVGTCYAGDTDLNRAMVRAGHAVPYLEFSRRYADDVVAPPRYTAPAAYRRSGGSIGAGGASRATDTACGIKGNISSRGVRIYHLPGSRSYAATRIDESRGERWFCSVREAEAAGWRAVRR